MSTAKPVNAVSFVAKSGTGKTTLLEKLIIELRSRGYRVGAFKAISHLFEIDQPGKDSYRMAAAGAEATLICSAEKLAFVSTHSEKPQVNDLLNQYFQDVDIVLVEGYKRGPLPKIELARQEQQEQLLCCSNGYDPSYIAVASDTQLDLDIPVFDLNDPVVVCDFLIDFFHI